MAFIGCHGRWKQDGQASAASQPGRSPPHGLPWAHHRQGGRRACPHINPGGSSRLPGLHEALEELAILGALSMHRSRVRIPYVSPHWVQSVVAWHTCLASRRTGLKSRWIHQSAGSPHRAGKGAHPEGRAPAGPGFTKVRVPWANRPSRHPLKVEIPGSNPGGTASQQGGVG